MRDPVVRVIRGMQFAGDSKVRSARLLAWNQGGSEIIAADRVLNLAPVASDVAGLGLACAAESENRARHESRKPQCADDDDQDREHRTGLLFVR